MKRRYRSTILAVMLLFLLGAIAAAQAVTPQVDILGSHDLGAGTSAMRGPNANACSYCHIAHGGLSSTPLWNQTLSTQTYQSYSSNTEQNVAVQPAVGKTSTLCLSCHDGTVALGQTVAIGTLKMTGTMTPLGTKLQGSHPFSLQLPLKDAAHLSPTLVATGDTTDATGAVKLIDKNIECNTCHNVHNQFIDKRSHKFLVRDNAGGQICLSCHQTTPRTVNSRDNSLAAWNTSAHNTSTATLAANASLTGYETVAQSACSTCHSTHNASGPGLLRKNATIRNNVDDTSQACFTCHDGGGALTQPLLNILGETQKRSSHPFGDSNNQHSLNEAVVLQNNRHATCADCHNGHGARPTTDFAGTPELRPSQANVAGVRLDGTAVNTATNQYENCLRCHGTSSNKQSLPIYGTMPARALTPGDTLNVLAEFSNTATSSHPVMRDATSVAQPSLLPAMLNQSGVQSRSMGTRILCTDCHNSDDNREFGGAGPNGPHGSKNVHILEREYIISQVAAGAGAGSSVINLNPTPTVDPTNPAAPYSMCAKCHNLTIILSDSSFSQHSEHINKGFSCSVCHSAHGVPAGTAGVNGKRLVNFDMNVVAPKNGVVSYNGGTSCTLTCHGREHN